MKRKECYTIMVSALIMGLLGGILSGRLFAGDPATADEAPVRHVLTAQALKLVDDRGRPRGELGVSESGEPNLTFLDGNGNMTAAFGLTQDGWPELKVLGRDGKAAAALLFLDGNPRLLLQDKSAEISTVLAAAPQQGHVVVYKKDTARASLSVDGLDLTDRDGRSRARLQASDDGEPSLSLRDKEGHRLVSLSIQPSPKKEEPLLAFYDKKESIRAGLNLDEDGNPSLILRDKPLLSLIDRAGDNGIFLSLEASERPSLLMNNKEAQRSAFLGLKKSGEMAFDLLAEKKQRRTTLFLSPDGDPFFSLKGKDGKDVWSVP